MILESGASVVIVNLVFFKSTILPRRIWRNFFSSLNISLPFQQPFSRWGKAGLWGKLNSKVESKPVDLSGSALFLSLSLSLSLVLSNHCFNTLHTPYHWLLLPYNFLYLLTTLSLSHTHIHFPESYSLYGQLTNQQTIKISHVK